MKKINVWKVKFYRCAESRTNANMWAEENVTANTIDDALKNIRVFGEQNEWVDLDIRSITFSYQVLVEEAGDLK